MVCAVTAARQPQESADDRIKDAFESLCEHYGVNGSIVFLRREAVHARRPQMQTARHSVVLRQSVENSMVAAFCMRLDLHAAAVELVVDALEKTRLGHR